MSVYTPATLAVLKTVVGRSADGTGNNLMNFDWGSTDTTFVRVTPNSYDDGVSSIDPTLPTVKLVSDTMFDLGPDQQDDPNKAGHNENIVFFGQLIVHDIVFTAGPNPAAGIPVVPFPDATFPFGVRNGAVIVDGVAQQINTKTSFLDLSMVYGTTQEITDLLTDGKRMILGPDDFLPSAAEIDNSGGLLTGPFFTGDQRANQTPQLLSQQMIWARNHNWHVDKLEAKYGDSWTDAEIYNAARAMNEAEYQNVVYNEYLTTLFGDCAIGKYKGYDATVNPSIINEFTAVASRFGHDQSSNTHSALNEDGSVVVTKSLAEAFGDGFAGLANSGEILDQWLRGQLAQVSQDTDGKVVDGNRELLFGAPLDLESVDIGRGRDHGAGDYNALREGIGLKAYKSIDEFSYKNKVSAADTAALKSLYDGDIGRVDAIVGALLEKDMKGSTLGETITKIHAMQFEALRDGDRFYFENQFKYDQDLVKSIKQTSFAEIIGRNTDIDYVYHDAFASHTRKGGTEGSNWMNGDNGRDLMIGYGGNDVLKARGGSDDVHGGNGCDKLYGEYGDDFLFGGKDNDMLNGSHGNDALYGGAGKDSLYGGQGRDTFHFAEGDGRDTIRDFNVHQDKIDLSEVVGFKSYAAVKAAMKQVGHATVIDLGDGDTVTVDHVKKAYLKACHFDYTDDYMLA